MTLIDGKGTKAATGTMGALAELPLEDRPSCPACGAGPALQATVAWVPDGALEIVILACTSCAKDHPVWF